MFARKMGNEAENRGQVISRDVELIVIMRVFYFLSHDVFSFEHGSPNFVAKGPDYVCSGLNGQK